MSALDQLVNRTGWDCPHWVLYIVIAGWIAIPLMIWLLPRIGKTKHLLTIAVVAIAMLVLANPASAQGVHDGRGLDGTWFQTTADWIASGGMYRYMLAILSF